MVVHSALYFLPEYLVVGIRPCVNTALMDQFNQLCRLTMDESKRASIMPQSRFWADHIPFSSQSLDREKSRRWKI